MRAVNQGLVELRAPSHTHVATLIDFVANNGKFLSKALTIPQQASLPPILTSGDTLYIFGQKYTLVLTSANKTSVELDRDNQILTIKKRGEKLSRAQCYKNVTYLLEAYLSTRTSELAPQLSRTHNYKKIRTKLVRSLWGSCSRNGNLTFNKRLIHYPTPIIDYVIIHELAHLQQHNHSNAFWDIVKLHFPDVKSARAVLKKRAFG